MDITNQINQDRGISRYLDSLMENPLGPLLQEVNSPHNGHMNPDQVRSFSSLVINGTEHQRNALQEQVQESSQAIQQCIERVQVLMNAAPQGADSPQVVQILQQLEQDYQAVTQSQAQVIDLVRLYLIPDIEAQPANILPIEAQPASVLPPTMQISEDINAPLPG